MARNRPSVAQLAIEANLDVDEALLTLWDHGFNAVACGTDCLAPGQANRARRILGLATRRELATPEHWQKQFGISRDQLDAALRSLGVTQPYIGANLSKKALNRLRSELRATPSLSHSGESSSPQTSQSDWEIVGHERPLRLLSLEEVGAIHDALVADFRQADDPIEPSGVRSENLLASAASRPSTAIGDVAKYPTIEMAGAALFHSLVHNHPFHNGNKRTALVALLVFLDENGLMLTCHEDELFKVVLQVAQHSIVDSARADLADRETLAMARWIKGHSRWIEKGDRAITWRRLEQILSAYGCEYVRSGTNIAIRRVVTTRVRYVPWLSTQRRLQSQIHFAGNGREIAKSAVNKVRRDLELDDDHGVDSQAFYDDAQVSTSDFIARYRKTLTRLARL